jgi:hypothetical protein
MNLESQLPRRNKNKRLRCPRHERSIALGELLEKRQPVSGRLASAGLGDGHKVPAFEKKGDSLDLDWGWSCEIFGAQSAKNWFGKTERIER